MCDLKFLLNNKLYLGKKEKFVRLSICKQKYFDKFIKELERLNSNNEITLIYRGISFNNIFDKLSISKNSPTKYEELSKKLFMIGEKSQYFLQDISEIAPEDISNNAFAKIFDMLGSKDWYNTGFFIERNKVFFDFFFDKKNKSRFIEIMKAKTEKEQRYYRDYYFKLLHQLDYIRYKKFSFFISTTRNFNTTNDFFKGNGIVLFSWKKKNLEFINNNNEDFLICNDMPFENEEEETEYKGIFPHYIYGFLVVDNGKHDKFIVNHHLFSLFNRKIEYVIKFGIFIDQSNFEEVLSRTKYKKYFVG